MSPMSTGFAPILFRFPGNLRGNVVFVRRVIGVIVIATILVFSWLRLQELTRSLDRHVDEAAWIASSLHYTDLVLAGDFSSSAWEGSHLDSWGSLNPHLGHLWIGMFLRLNPTTRDLRLSLEQGHLLTEDLFSDPTPILGPHALEIARQANAVAGIVCLALLYLIAYRIGGIAPAATATLLVSRTSAFEHVMPRALTDGPFNALLLAATLALLEFTRVEEKKSLRWIVISGVLFGLAFNVKMSALIIGCATLAGIITLRAFRLRSGVKPDLLLFVAGFGGAVASAYVANPYFWPIASPPANGGTLEAFRLTTPKSNEGYSFARGTGPVPLRLAEAHFRWKHESVVLLDRLSTLYGYKRPTRAVIARRLAFTHNHRWFGIGVLMFSCSGLVWQFARGGLTAWSSVEVPLVGTSVNVLFLFALLNLDIERYYLPAIFQIHLLEYCALGLIAAALLRRSVRSHSESPSR